MLKTLIKYWGYSSFRPKQEEIIQSVLESHILESVLFMDEIRQMYADGAGVFIEFGPKGVLTGLVGAILEDSPHLALSLNPNPRKSDVRQFCEGVVQLQIAGICENTSSVFSRLDV